MSVANEALKSVHEIEEERSSVSVSHLDVHPADRAKAEKPGPRLTLPSLIYASVLFTFLILGVLLLRTINHRIQARAAAATLVQSGVVSGSDTPVVTPVTKTPSSAPATTTAMATPSPAYATPSVPATFATLPAPAKPSQFKLQAVFFNPAHPSAIVGGKTVFVGDPVGPYRITRINPTSVSLENGDQIRELHLQ